MHISQTKLNNRSRQRGYVLIVLGVSIVTLVSFAGLVFDVGQLLYYKRLAQTAADAGALGGTHEIAVNPTNVVTAVRDDATLNGFTHGVANATVTVNIPPTTGSFTTNAKAVEVIVTKRAPTLFLGALNIMNMTVRARAVGKMGGATDCVLALNLTDPQSLQLQGNVTVNSPGCSFVVNSSSSTAMTVGNSSCITAADINIAGNYTSGGCAPSPTPSTGMTPLVDPLSDLPAPTFNGCDNSNLRVSTNVTLSPGVYCGGITVNGSGNVITLQPGLYILNGGAIDASGGNIITGTGVTFYNTGNNTHHYADFNMTGGVQYNLSAPTSGTYAGILIFQDRNFDSRPPHGNIITGNSASTMDGVIYMPSGLLMYQGSSSANGYTNIVADKVIFSGNSTLNNNYGVLADGPPLKTQAALVE